MRAAFTGNFLSPKCITSVFIFIFTRAGAQPKKTKHRTNKIILFSDEKTPFHNEVNIQLELIIVDDTDQH